MVIEHTFVTTMDAPDALRLASEFLSQRGFVGLDRTAFPMEGAWKTLEMTRGKKKAARAKSVSELPQSIRLDFDRGRITIAASISANASWGGSQWGGVGFGLDATSTNYSPKRMQLHTDLLTSIARGLELLLSQKSDPATAAADWSAVESRIAAAAKKRRTRQLILLAVFLIFIFGAITLIVLATTRH